MVIKMSTLCTDLYAATYVAQSRLGWAAGMGLFVSRAFRPYEVIALLDPRERCHPIPPRKHSALGGYANDGNGPVRGRNNARLADVGITGTATRLCVLFATCNIHAHEEVLVDYGSLYWSEARRGGNRKGWESGPQLGARPNDVPPPFSRHCEGTPTNQKTTSASVES